MAKAKRRSPGSSHSKRDPAREDVLKVGILQPGERIFVDHYESDTRARLAHTYGCERKASQYKGGTIFYDAATGYIKTYHQTTFYAKETIQSKHRFEADIAQCGVTVQTYRTDNGSDFTSAQWQQELESNNQIQSFSGAGAQFQNALAERSIQTVCNSARAMLLHLNIHWPDQYNTRLWGFALDYAVWLWNHTPRQDHSMSPIELFCQTKTSCEYLRRARVFGAPCYILDHNFRDGKKIPKWKPRARLGMWLGFSPHHSSSVGLVLNLQTGKITPQFHYIIDNKFTTVPGGIAGRSTPAITQDALNIFLRSKFDTEDREYALADWDPSIDGDLPPLQWDEHPPSIDGQLLPDPDESDRRRVHWSNDPPIQHFIDDTVPDAAEASPDDTSEEDEEDEDDAHVAPPTAPTPSSPSADPVSPLDSVSGSPVGGISDSDRNRPAPTRRTRSGRTHREPNRLTASEKGELKGFYTRMQDKPPSLQEHLGRFTGATAAAMTLDWNKPACEPTAKYFEILLALSTCPVSGQLFDMHPLALQARLMGSPEQPSYNDVMRMDDQSKEEWRQSMDKEIAALYKQKAMKLVNRTAAKGRQIVPSTWALKVKTYPDGAILKKKSRLCIRGDQMYEGLHEGELAKDSDGYAPVIEWGTLRLLLTLVTQHQLVTTQVDFRNAFTQAPLDRPMFMELPQGLKEIPKYKNKVFQLDRSLYGHVFAARLFYKLIRTALTGPDGLGFECSINDLCLFIRKDCIIITWVDDAVIISKDPKTADKIIADLLKRGLDLEKEHEHGALENYLGVKFEDLPTGEKVMLQQGLIDRIVEATHMQNGNPKDTPATDVLTKSLDKPAFSGDYNYRSVVGMMLYLANTSHPDIAFAVNQCARFSTNPREPHHKAIKRIVGYLKKTRNEGMRIRPTKKNTLDCWVDSDFAGLIGKEDPQDPSSTRSRTGFIICLGDNPVFWQSKLQTITALHTMESEYIAASTAMKSLLFLRRVHEEICTKFDLPFDPKSNISTIFEDNQAALILATTDPPRLTPRAKSIAVHYHWFRQYLKPDSIVMKSIDSPSNRSNQLTKPLGKLQFERERKLLMGF